MLPSTIDMTRAALANEMFRHPLPKLSDDNMQMVVQSFTAEDGGTGNEIHQRSSQLSTVIAGRGMLRLAHGVTIPLGPGMTFRVPPRTQHDIVVDFASDEPLKLATMYAPPLHAPPDKYIQRRVNNVEDEIFGTGDYDYRPFMPKQSGDTRRETEFLYFTGNELTSPATEDDDDENYRTPVVTIDLAVAAILHGEDDTTIVPGLSDENIQTSILTLSKPYIFPKELFVSYRITIVGGSGAFTVYGDDNNEVVLNRGATFLLSPGAPTVAVQPLLLPLKLIIVQSPLSQRYY